MPLAFVRDEHLRGPLWQALLRHNLAGDDPLDATCVGEASELPLGVDDPTILCWAEREARLIVTEDRHTMARHLQAHLDAGGHSPGILLARSGVRLRQLAECLILVAHAGEPVVFADAVTYIPWQPRSVTAQVAARPP